jgi:polyglutamine-binding protein 1
MSGGFIFRYGIKNYTPDSVTEKRRRKMLKKYPLSGNWREVPDANLDRCYYWNLETDEVSWLPPSHPRSHITQSAIKLRQKEMERKAIEAQRQASGSTKKKKKKKKNPDDVRNIWRD